MSTPRHNELERIRAEYEARRQAITGLQRELAGMATTVTSKNRRLSVTMDTGGNVTEVKFLAGGWRTMSATELGSLIVDTIRQAREQSFDTVARTYGSALPTGLPVADMLRGSADVAQLMDGWLAASTNVQGAEQA